MPLVTFKITRDDVTTRQKEALIAGATQLLAQVLGKNPETTIVIIEEIESDNWGIAGQSVTNRRAKPHTGQIS